MEIENPPNSVPEAEGEAMPARHLWIVSKNDNPQTTIVYRYNGAPHPVQVYETFEIVLRCDREDKAAGRFAFRHTWAVAKKRDYYAWKEVKAIQDRFASGVLHFSQSAPQLIPQESTSEPLC